MKHLFIFILMALATTAHAQTSKLRALDTEYAAASWKAVGRIDFGRGGQCSGTLITKDLVLTAAHCLYMPDNTLWPISDIQFHAGLRNGKAVVTRRASKIAAHEKYIPEGDARFENIPYDIALIQLAEPISTFEVAPFHLFQEAVGPGPVSVVSYGQGRSNVQSRQKECQMMDRERDVMLFDCDVTYGSSGAPVFTHKNGRGQIMSVISNMAMLDGEKRSFGMVLPGRVNELKRQLRMQVAPPTAKARRVTLKNQNNRSGLSAKFLRPGG